MKVIKVESESDRDAGQDKFDVAPRYTGKPALARPHLAQLLGESPANCESRPIQLSYNPQPERWGLNE